jgi:hypothetical protein
VGTRDYRVGAMIVTLDGGEVSSVAVDGPAAAPRTILNDVSCTGSLCVAVGGDVNDSNFTTRAAVFERETDGSWAPVALRKVPVLRAVSCAGAASCVALEEPVGPNVLVRTAAGWQRSSVPSPSGGTSHVLSDVDCYAPDACVVTGSFTTTSGRQRQMFARWDGQSWSAISVPPATTLTGDLSAGPLDCTSTGVCFAAGWGASYSSKTAFVARLKGNSVSVTALPIPTDRGPIVYATITDLSCSSATYCLAGGLFQTDDPQFGTVYYDAMVLSSGVWAYSDSLKSQAVSCAADDFCGLAVDGQGGAVVVRTEHRK